MADNNTETIPATLGRRNVKLSQTKAISLDHPFLGSQRSKTKHSFYYLQGKKGEKEKKGEGEMYKVKKKKENKNRQTADFMSKPIQQVVPVFWLGLGLFGLQRSLHRPDGI